jgi:hypothetical protein
MGTPAYKEKSAMSDTRKSAQQSREGVQQVRDATQAAVDSTVRTARETTARAEDVFNRTADEARNIGSSVADTMARSADAAVDITQRVAEQGRDVVWLGVRTAAGVNGRFADVNYGRSHRVLESTARALETYRAAGESTAENVQALFATYLQVGRGLQQMQHAYLEILDRSLERATHKPQDLLRTKSIEEFAEVQRDLYLDAVNHAIEASSTLLQIAGRVAEEAVRPLQNRMQIARA